MTDRGRRSRSTQQSEGRVVVEESVEKTKIPPAVDACSYGVTYVDELRGCSPLPRVASDEEEP